MENNLNNNEINNDYNTPDYSYEKKNNGVKVLLIIVIVLVLCLIGLLSYKIFVVDKKNDNNVVEQNNNTKDNVGTLIEIYDDQNYGSRYINKPFENTNPPKVGELKCKSECLFLSASKDYVLVEENNKYALYNYVTNTLIKENLFNNLNGPSFYFISDLDDNAIAVAAIVGDGYSAEDKTIVYNISNDKEIEFEGVEGRLSAIGSINMNYYKSLYSYKLIELRNGIYSFENGKKIFDSIEDLVIFNNNLYVINKNEKETNICDSTGKVILDKIGVKKLYSIDNNLLLLYHNKFEIYNTDFKKVFESKTYDEILSISKKYFLVLNNKKLEIIDLDSNLVTVLDDYSNVKNIYENKLIDVDDFNFNRETNEDEILFSVKTNKVTLEELIKDEKEMSDDLINDFKLNGNNGQFGYQYIYNVKTKQTKKYAKFFPGHD